MLEHPEGDTRPTTNPNSARKLRTNAGTQTPYMNKTTEGSN